MEVEVIEKLEIPSGMVFEKVMMPDKDEGYFVFSSGTKDDIAIAITQEFYEKMRVLKHIFETKIGSD